MADDTIFETRLAAALERYGELAPAMDDEAIARAAIDAGGRRTGWLDALRDALFGPTARSRPVRAVYLTGLLALLLAAILAAVVGGFRNEPSPLPGRNGAIVLSVSSNAHQAATVATGPDGTGQRPIQAGRCPMHSRDGSVLAWLSYDGSAADLVVAAPDGSRPRTMLLVDPADQSVSYARVSRRHPGRMVQARSSRSGRHPFARRAGCDSRAPVSSCGWRRSTADREWRSPRPRPLRTSPVIRHCGRPTVD